MVSAKIGGAHPVAYMVSGSHLPAKRNAIDETRSFTPHEFGEGKKQELHLGTWQPPPFFLPEMPEVDTPSAVLIQPPIKDREELPPLETSCKMR